MGFSFTKDYFGAPNELFQRDIGSEDLNRLRNPNLSVRINKLHFLGEIPHQPFFFGGGGFKGQICRLVCLRVS